MKIGMNIGRLGDFCEITNRSKPNPEGMVATSFNIMHLCSFGGGKRKMIDRTDMMERNVHIIIEEVEEK